MYVRQEDNVDDAVNLFRLSLEPMLASTKRGVVWEIKPKTKKRTNLQNRFMFKNFQHVAKFLNAAGMNDDAFGVSLAFTAERIHEITKRALGKVTTTKDNTKEFSDYMEQVFVFWIEKTNGFWTPLESTRGYFERNRYKINEEGEIEL